MSHNRFRFVVVASWFTAIVALVAIRLGVTAATLSLVDGSMALALMFAPPLVFLIVFRAPAVTVTQVLYRVERSGQTQAR